MKHLFLAATLFAFCGALSAQTTLKTYDSYDADLNEEVNVGDAVATAQHVLTQSAGNTVVTAEQLNTVLQEIRTALASLESKITNLETQVSVVGAAVDPVSNYSYVDLGLPSGTLWATCNVGASTPDEYGLFFAWGDIVGHEIFCSSSYGNWSNYKWRNGTMLYDCSKYTIADGQTKYSWYDENGVFVGDNIRTLELVDDAARSIQGGGWRIPTAAEVEELMDECQWEWYNTGACYGYKITGPNENHIFLPAANVDPQYPSNTVETNKLGYYWTSSLSFLESYSAMSLNFDNNSYPLGPQTRNRLRAIRPVCKLVTKL